MTTAEMEATAVKIDPRFCGPDHVGNGGYVSGLLLSRMAEPAEVTLRRPAPLDRELRFEWYEDVLLLCDDEETIAAAEPIDFHLDIPAPPSYREAAEAARLLFPPEEHPFPNCFVCGPARSEGDGLRLFPGPVGGRDLMAAPWTPGDDLAGPAPLVRDEFVCAALDCPGAFAAKLNRPAVLGRFAVNLVRPVLAGDRYVVVGWSRGTSGRKHYVGTALFSEDGTLHAAARATWVEVNAA